jgi:hypothetical protein
MLDPWAQRDLMLGSCVLEEGGIIIMDDYLNPKWLGVPEGTMLFLNHQDKVQCSHKAPRPPLAY